MVLYCYVDADFVGRWVNEDPQYPTCVMGRTGFVVTFSKLYSIVGVKFIDRDSYI